MSVRDFLNKGIYIDDVEVLAAALPEAAPTLVTDGYATVVSTGSGPEIVVPFVAVWCDIDGGAAPTATLNLWGYIEPPAAGSELNADWQLIDTVVVSDSVGLTPTLALIPILGLTRFAVSVQSFTGGATGIGYRLVGISPHAAQAIISMGAAAGVAANVNLVEVGGTTVVTGGVAGTQGVGGLAAQDAAVAGNPNLMGLEAADFDGVALPNAVDAEGDVVAPKASLRGVQYIMLVNEDGSATALVPEGTVAGEGLQVSLDDGTDSVFAQGDPTGNFRVVGNVAHDAVDAGDPVKQGYQAVSALPTAVAHGDRVNGVADLRGRQMTAPFDLVNQADRVTRENPDYAQVEGNEIVDIVNGVSGVGGAAVTYDYYFSPETFGKTYLSWRLHGGAGGAGITMKIYMTAQDDGTAKESCDYDDMTNDLVGAATITAAAGASNDDYLVDNAGLMAEAKWIHVEVVVDATTGTADWTIFKRQRYIG